jgi:hypothetical protein
MRSRATGAVGAILRSLSKVPWQSGRKQKQRFTALAQLGAERPPTAEAAQDQDRQGEHMKRTARAMTLLAALGGGCMTQQMAPDANSTLPTTRVGATSETPGLIGPWGEPVAPTVARGKAPEQVTPAKYTAKPQTPSPIQQTSATTTASKVLSAEVAKDGQLKQKLRTGQIPPAPPMGPPGAVAAIPGPALPGGLPVMGTARSSVRFVGQDGMRIGWFAPLGDGRMGFREQLESPGRYNFLQGGVYRLRLSNIPKRPGVTLYPTIEVLPQNPKTATFLAHSSIPLAFTDDDFDQAINGNFVVKVIYLPDPAFQDLAVPGPDEIVSTRLEPGVDPVQEAQRRGSVLLIVRMGNIDLESQGTPGMDAPNPYQRAPMPPSGGPAAAPPVPPPPPTGKGPTAAAQTNPAPIRLP